MKEKDIEINLNSNNESNLLSKLQLLIERKNFNIIDDLGGVSLILELLNSNEQGLQQQQVINNRNHFGSNERKQKKGKPLWHFILTAIQDKILIMLSIAALISLSIGIFKTLTYKDEPSWIEGLAIVCSVFIVVTIGSLNDWKKEKQFQALNQLQNETQTITCLRNNKNCNLNIAELVSGDIILLEPGQVVPVDALVLKAQQLKLDESSVTGESDIIYKTPYDKNLKKLDPILISGSKVLDGQGSALVLLVGENCFWGKILANLNGDAIETPLQSKLNILANQIAKLGSIIALIMLVTLIILLVVMKRYEGLPSYNIVMLVINIVITTITIIVVAVPEGLPLAVTLALAFATRKMLKDNNLVRVISACETMANATVICSDKTGTLTQNKMTVVQGTLQDLDIHSEPFKIISKEFFAFFAGFCSTSYIKPEFKEGESRFIGSKTECAILDFVFSLKEYKENLEEPFFIQPFNSENKLMFTIQKKELEFIIYLKGASELILDYCSRFESSDQVLSLDDIKFSQISNLINQYGTEGLRTIGMAYKKVILTQQEYDSYLELDAKEKEVFWTTFMNEFIWFSLLGIEDPLRDGVKESIEKCFRAGINVKMVTGDNLITAKSIALKSGIFNEEMCKTLPSNVPLREDGFPIVMEGKEFRTLSEEQTRLILPYLRVLARSSPEDKMNLVNFLKGNGEVVCVTGDGTNDAPALKAANVGFSMGISGTEVAREASDIILMDDNFSSIIKAIEWGRTVNDSVKKFLQFQLTVNITAVIVTFITACLDPNSRSSLTAVQLLWVNLIMDTLAALALATDPPRNDVLDRKPLLKSDPLITLNMWKMILGQAIYQLIMTSLLYNINQILIIEEELVSTIIFNSFVFMQLFNEFNCRQITSKLNIFQDIHKNSIFLLIMLITFLVQILIVQFGDRAFNCKPLGINEWLICIICGILSLPIGIIIRLIPNQLFTLCKGSILDLEPNDNVHGLIKNEINLHRTLRGKRVDASKSCLEFTLVPSIMATSVCIGIDDK